MDLLSQRIQPQRFGFCKQRFALPCGSSRLLGGRCQPHLSLKVRDPAATQALLFLLALPASALVLGVVPGVTQVKPGFLELTQRPKCFLVSIYPMSSLAGCWAAPAVEAACAGGGLGSASLGAKPG